MSMNPQQEAIQEAQRLSTLPEDALYEDLGVRAQDIFNVGGYQRAQQYSADFEQAATDMFGVEDVQRFGRKLWKKLEPQLSKVVCGAGNEDRKKILQGKDVPEIAASIVTAGIFASLGPPSWVVVIAAILAKNIAQAGLDALCEEWKESMNEN